MGIKSIAVKPIASFVSNNIRKWSRTAVEDQLGLLTRNVGKAKDTKFGVDHNFSKIKNYDDFKTHIPVRDYEGIKDYIDMIVVGRKDILWPGRPKYFAKTSGTTSGIKYIPLTADSMPNHMNTARSAMMSYIAETGNSRIFNGKMIFLSGSPTVYKHGGIDTGRLSGIVNHEIPRWLKGNQLPSFKTNCIEEWEEKLDKIIGETLYSNMSLISGIPPWVQMYYEKLLDITGKDCILDIFPNFSLFMYGGVNYEPYRSKLESLVGKKIDSVEVYPASEGFIAFQDSQDDASLLLNSRSGIFYEFVPVPEIFNENPTRLHLGEVEIGVDYAIIINNNAGLWGYNLGDSVRFTSLSPYKLLVSGRIKHFISAFGEHVIGKEVETALLEVVNVQGVKVIEFTVAPQVNPTDGGAPFHEWFIEFDGHPGNIENIARQVDQKMEEKNIYYKDLIEGKILQPLKMRSLISGAFREYMKREGKLGGQNKVPRLSNDRKIADKLMEYVIDK